MHFKAENIVPFVAWLRHYNTRHLRADILAGLTVAVVSLPQSMAYALIAGLPVQYGLYASIVPTIVGSLWGSSAHLITGPATAVSLVVFSTLSEVAPPGSSLYLELAFFLALMMGGIQIAMGIARLGNLLNFVSHSVLLGFTAGAAVLIVFQQMPALLGIHLERGGTFMLLLIHLASLLHRTHPITLLVGGVTIAVILLIKKLPPDWPGTLIAMILAGLLVFLFKLDARGVGGGGPFRTACPLGFHPRNLSPGWVNWPPVRWPSLSWAWWKLFPSPSPLPIKPANGSILTGSSWPRAWPIWGPAFSAAFPAADPSPARASIFAPAAGRP